MPHEPFSHPDHPWEPESRWAGSRSEPGGQPRPDAKPGREDSELLEAVLRETVGRITDEEAHEVISGWFASQPPGRELCVEVVRSLVKHILGRRFRGWSCTQEQLGRLARWLWEDPAARARLELLWNEASER